jgi:hypothetical protein
LYDSIMWLWRKVVLKLGCCISTSQKLVGRAQAFLVSGRFSCERVLLNEHDNA